MEDLSNKLKFLIEEVMDTSSETTLISLISGCIDGTHIVIDLPSNSKNEYIDRKGNVTLCMQGVGDGNRKYINIYVGFPGPCHDSCVLKNSPLYQKLRSACGDFHLLGDSAYPCTRHLVTPYKDNEHLTRAQKTST